MRSETEQNKEARFHALYLEQYAAMLRYAQAVLRTQGRGSGRAEDAVQETFAFAWTRMDELLTSPKPEGWLFRALHFKLLEQNREEQKWQKALAAGEALPVSAEDPEPEEDSELSALVSAFDYTLLRRLYVEGWSYRDLCRVYGMKQSALAVRVSRAKEKIRKQLKIDNSM